MIRVTTFQRLLSYIIPVKLWQGSGEDHTSLELCYYWGEWQLSTDDALYSDGSRYRPLLMAFKKLRKDLPGIKQVLVLGAGIGSAVHVLRRLGAMPEITLVDNDATILDLAQQTLTTTNNSQDIHFIHDDAAIFIQEGNASWDVIVIDIFKGRVVPPFVTTEGFMQQCRQRLKPGGTVIINYMLQTQDDWHPFKALIQSVFTSTNIIELGINRIILAKP